MSATEELIGELMLLMNDSYRHDEVLADAINTIKDLRDIAVCADTYLSLTQCAGGRTVVDGYVCPHCDSTSPRTRCKGVGS